MYELIFLHFDSIQKGFRKIMYILESDRLNQS
jgi:hypothetical protein